MHAIHHKKTGDCFQSPVFFKVNLRNLPIAYRAVTCHAVTTFYLSSMLPLAEQGFGFLDVGADALLLPCLEVLYEGEGGAKRFIEVDKIVRASVLLLFPADGFAEECHFGVQVVVYRPADEVFDFLFPLHSVCHI